VAEYLLIESSAPGDGPGRRFVGDAARLASDGAAVALLLIENGVTGAVRDTAPVIGEFLGQGGRLWVDAFSVRQRALAEADLIAGARLVSIAEVADKLLAPGVRAVWH
jgi:predicted peroxiredoxin